MNTPVDPDGSPTGIPGGQDSTSPGSSVPGTARSRSQLPASSGRERERVVPGGRERERVVPGGRERERVAQNRRKGHLPRLAPGFYRGRAFVHWTPTIENRATGWLTDAFHHAWRLCLLHSSARFHLACPAYVLMPDHMHVVWLGLREDSNQLPAIEFFRSHLGSALLPAVWQRQAHDHVLSGRERDRDALANAVRYIFENPIRVGLVPSFVEYPYLGCCVPGYPDLDIRAGDYWEIFWRIFDRVAARHGHSLTLAAT